MPENEVNRVCEERFARDKERLDRQEQREERISENLSRASALLDKTSEKLDRIAETVKEHDKWIRAHEKRPSTWLDRAGSALVNAVVAACVSGAVAWIIALAV